jgi:hypothetical protein
MTNGAYGQMRRRLAARVRLVAALVACGTASASCASILGFEDGSLATDAGNIGPSSESGAGSDGAGGPGAEGGGDAALDAAMQTDALSGGDAADAGDVGLDSGNVGLDSGADGGTKQAFATTLTFNGRLDAPGVAGAGGLAAGDARCNEAALAAFPSRTFVAWLSTSGTSAASRLTGGGPWYLGPTLLGGLTELTTGNLKTLLNKAPDGSAIPLPSGVWTGTEANGTANAETCTDWTSMGSAVSAEIGNSGATGIFWTYATARSCDVTYHLYCFEK